MSGRTERFSDSSLRAASRKRDLEVTMKGGEAIAGPLKRRYNIVDWKCLGGFIPRQCGGFHEYVSFASFSEAAGNIFVPRGNVEGVYGLCG